MRSSITPYRLAWSYKVGRLFGIDIKVHLIFIVLLAAVFILNTLTHSLAAGLGTLIFIGLLFMAVLLHELGHSLAAQRLGIRVHDITLWPLGGMARLSEIPEIPAVELIIAVAGPAVNFTIILVTLFLTYLGAGLDAASGLVSSLYLRPLGNELTLLEFIFQMNFWMMTINLVPAFPLDGGRILRALVARRLPYLKATALAVRIGKILSMAAFFIMVFSGEFYMIVALICLFVYWAGSHELHAARAREYMRAAQSGYGGAGAQSLRDLFAAFGQAAAGGSSGAGGATAGDKSPNGDGVVLEAEVLSTDTDAGDPQMDGAPGQAPQSGQGPQPGQRPPSVKGYRNLSPDELERHLGQLERDFLRMVQMHGKGDSSRKEGKDGGAGKE